MSLVSAAPPPPLGKAVTFDDLNEDVIAHIGFLASPPSAAAVAPHWHNGQPQSRTREINDILALRATCKRIRRALPAPRLDITIHGDYDLDWRLSAWADAPDWVLARVRRIRLLGTYRADSHHTLPVARARFVLFKRLISRATFLEAVEISHNPFCSHDAYGLGLHRDFLLDTSAVSFQSVPAMKEVVIAVKCRVCTLAFGALFASWCPSLWSLKCAVVTHLSPLDTLAPLIPQALRVLHLKVGDDWKLPTVLSVLQPCAGLQELNISCYDASRKVHVADTLDAQLWGWSSSEHLSREDAWVRGRIHVLGALGQLSALRSLDLCWAPSTLVLIANELEGWETGALAAIEVLAETLPRLQRGWWWTQVTDLDYHQLKGYERRGWSVAESGSHLDPLWQHLSPMVVRNEDGQGSVIDIPSEEWY